MGPGAAPTTAGDRHSGKPSGFRHTDESGLIVSAGLEAAFWRGVGGDVSRPGRGGLAALSPGSAGGGLARRKPGADVGAGPARERRAASGAAAVRAAAAGDAGIINRWPLPLSRWS